MNQSLPYIENLIHLLGNYKIEELKNEPLNIDYEGTHFVINDYSFRSRLAKLTPKKKGYFVVFWKKDTAGKNQPYSFDDSPDKVIVSIIDHNFTGQFIFPKNILLRKGILSSETNNGKMAIRVYPTWVKELNSTATKTQNWQKEYFIDTSVNVDLEKLKHLYFSH